MNLDRKVLITIFISSASSLAFEVLLTRIFSISLWYHFAFMIVSIAMLGFGASGTALALNPRLRDMSGIGWYALALGISMTSSYLVTNRIPLDPVRLGWDKWQLFYIALYYLTFSLPFFFIGLLLATAFSAVSKESGRLYGADLLGAGFGSLGVLGLMYRIPPEQGVYLISMAALAAAFGYGGKYLKLVTVLFMAADLALFLHAPEFAKLRISEYKGLESAIRYPGAVHLKTWYTPFSRLDAFKSPAARFAPGLALSYLDRLPDQIGLSIDAGELTAVTAADEKKLAFLDQLPASLPYALGKKKSALLLDPRGGLHVLLANRHQVGRIVKVETNPDLVRVLREDFGAFSGGIYSDDTWTGLGRSWLKGRKELFDLIDLSLLGVEPAGGFGIAEEYRYTVEAFREYLAHLEPDGLLCLNLYIIPPPRLELRLLATIAAAMEEMGEAPSGHVAAVRSWGSLCLLVKKTPLSSADITAVRRFAAERRFDLAYLPELTAAESNVHVKMPTTDYFAAFRDILDPAARKRFSDRYLFDITPVRDDAPFFHHFLKFGNLSETYRTMGRKWLFFLEEGYILPAIFVQVVLISLVLVALPAIGLRKKDPGDIGRGTGKVFLPYFALLGLGYMFVEIVLIQKFILLLETPPYAVATVLAALLASSGAGSLLGHRYPLLQGAVTPFALAMLLLLYHLLLPGITATLLPFSLWVKVALAFALLVPPGILMGIPFPTGLKLLGEQQISLIPWAWAMNGCCSVLAPPLAVICVMGIGFSGVLLLAALAYFLAAICLTAGTGD
ncbi:MAG: hypothetical protein HYS23_07590 [Geobacter sp.]|nr:hypothetical protein [Geobacter sp.]